MEQGSVLYKSILDILESELISSKASFRKAADKNYELLSPELIYDFASSLRPEDVKHLFRRQADYSGALVQKGLAMEGGVNISKVLMEQSSSVYNLARATTVAALDAWYTGTELPVIINCGNPYQGICVCQPVMEYVLELGTENDRFYRALAISNLISIYLTEGPGQDPGLCRAVAAGIGAGTAICYLRGGELEDAIKVAAWSRQLTAGLKNIEGGPLMAAEYSLGVEAGLMAMELWYAGKL